MRELAMQPGLLLLAMLPLAKQSTRSCFFRSRPLDRRVEEYERQIITEMFTVFIRDELMKWRSTANSRKETLSAHEKYGSK